VFIRSSSLYFHRFKTVQSVNHYLFIYYFCVCAVEELGIKELLPAYKDPTLQPKDLLTGVSFASGGTGYDSLTPKLVVGTFYTLIFFFFF
jgi:hypothetical protein